MKLFDHVVDALEYTLFLSLAGVLHPPKKKSKNLGPEA
jgi:hypothetical protein